MTSSDILIVPRWSGDETSDWYPWFRTNWPGNVDFAPLLPTKDAPEIDPSVQAVLDRLTDASILIGHSVGCQVAMRALARSGAPVPHLVLVAGWWDVDEPWDTIRPFIELPFDTSAVRAQRVTVLLSDDDPFTSDYRTTQRLFDERLGADVHLHSGAAHFNDEEAPQVLSALEWGRAPG